MNFTDELNVLHKNLVQREADLVNLNKFIAAQELDLAKIRDGYNEVVEEVELDTKSSEVIKKVFDYVSGQGFRFLENMVNLALDTVFQDENYKLRIQPGSRGREKTVEFWLHDGESENQLSECGGGVNVLVAFVFRVYYIIRFNLSKEVFLDESFVFISPQYIEPFTDFLTLLVDKYKFKFLWVSNRTDLEEHVHKYYEIRKGKLYEKK